MRTIVKSCICIDDFDFNLFVTPYKFGYEELAYNPDPGYLAGTG